jgi:hypothetical protein
MPQGIDYFNRGHWLSGIQARASYRARRRMFDIWLGQARCNLENSTLLDVGATPDQERLDSNCMLPWFHEAGLRVTLYSPEDISNLSGPFPFAEILAPKGLRLGIPAPDTSYDWVSASAVVEHVGSALEQEAFVRECGRVARRGVFLTCPNRGHWLEFHTKLPLLHWLPRTWHRALLRVIGLGQWAEEGHLRLLGRGELAKLSGRALGAGWVSEVRTVWTLGMPSNLVLLAARLHSPADTC